MPRCPNVLQLEIHHKNKYGDNSLDNAEVLCELCHKNTSTYGVAGRRTAPDFDEETKELAHKRANYQCECTRKCPHHL